MEDPQLKSVEVSDDHFKRNEGWLRWSNEVLIYIYLETEAKDYI